MSLKPRRCDECRRRKKRCDVDPVTDKCQYCLKKGIPCLIQEESLQIFHYTPSQLNAAASEAATTSFTSITPPSTTPPLRAVTLAFVDGPHSKKRRISESREELSLIPEITSSSLISVINRAKRHMSTTQRAPTLGFASMAKLFVPKQDLTMGDMFDDEMVPSSVPDTLKIPEKLSITDFLFSATRIQSLENATEDPEELLRLMLGEIRSFLEMDEKCGDVVEVLRERGYDIDTEGPRTQDSEMHNISGPLREKRQYEPLDVLLQSTDDVEFTIDLETMSSEFFIEKAGVVLEGGEKKKFCDVFGEGRVNDVIVSVLFDHFCNMTVPHGEMSNDPTPPKSYLAVCLPLIAGNATVMKSALLLGYHHWMTTHPTDMLRILQDDIERLHLEVLVELQDRLTNTTSLCCDHTLMCVILLLDVEMIRGMKSRLAFKLLALLQNLIRFRGGMREMTSTLTGTCLVRLTTAHLCAGMLSFKADQMETHDVLSLIDFNYILDHKPSLQFYDMLNLSANWCARDFKDVLRVYGNIFQLHNISGISYFANTCQDCPQLGDYDALSTQNLEYALQQADKLSKSITKQTQELKCSSGAPQKYAVQHAFSIRAAQLCLYQLVFRFNSLTPKTVLVVKELLKDVERLFDTLFALEDSELQRTLVCVYPLFCLGIDIVSSSRREWYLGQLETLHTRAKKRSLATAAELLRRVWALNPQGLTFVDSKALAIKLGFMAVFYT